MATAVTFTAVVCIFTAIGEFRYKGRKRLNDATEDCISYGVVFTPWKVSQWVASGAAISDNFRYQEIPFWPVRVEQLVD